MNKQMKLIQILSDNNYQSYALTMTYLLSDNMQEKYNDDVIYNNYSYKYNNATHLHDELADKLEKVSLIIFNKFYAKLLKDRHITRNKCKSLLPIIFYYFETMPYDERKFGLQNKPGFGNICPIHLHAMVMIPSAVDVSEYINEDALKPLHSMLQSSRLTKLNAKSDQGQWFSYIRKGAEDDSFFGYSDVHPIVFRDNPESFLNSIGIDCSQSGSSTAH